MTLKVRLTTFNLICIVLVQLIVIDVFLIAFFIRLIHTKSSTGNSQYSIHSMAAKDIPGKVLSKGYAPYIRSGYHPLESLVMRVIENEKQYGKSMLNRNIQIRRNSLPILSLLKNDPLGEAFAKMALYKPIVAAPQKAKDLTFEGTFIATTYDLSYASCGKYQTHPAYGITFSGKKAVKGRTIAVDPKVIPLGSKVHIEFPPPYTQMSGWYVAEDTGSAVNGNIIDVFLGESAFYEMEKFGSRIVKARIFPPDTVSSYQKGIERK